MKNNWENVKVTMDTGAAGHVMPSEMFPRLKMDCTSARKKFVAANGDRIEDMGEKTIPFKAAEGVHRVHKIQECKRRETLDLNEEGPTSWQCLGAG